MRFEDYLGCRISVVPAGPTGWLALVDMRDVGIRCKTSEETMKQAEAHVERRLAEQEERDRQAQFHDMALFLRSKFVVIQGGRDG